MLLKGRNQRRRTDHSNTLIELDKDMIPVKRDKFQDVEQHLEVPFPSKIPVLKYFIDTTTRIPRGESHKRRLPGK